MSLLLSYLQALLPSALNRQIGRETIPESPGGGICPQVQRRGSRFDRQGSRQRSPNDETALIGPVKDTVCAPAPGALGSGEGGKQIRRPER
jgi:hypothetical protein